MCVYIYICTSMYIWNVICQAPELTFNQQKDGDLNLQHGPNPTPWQAFDAVDEEASEMTVWFGTRKQCGPCIKSGMYQISSGNITWLWKIAIERVSFPIHDMVFFHSYFSH